MAGNMEAMLLGNDGDSSDDDIGNVGASATAPAPAATAAAPSKQSDYKARLKSLYSPANKVQPAQIQQRQTSQTHTSVPQTQQQSQQSQQNRIQQTSHHHQQPTSHMTRPNTQMSTTMMHIQSSSSNSRIQPPPHQLSAGQRKSSIAQSSVRPILTNRPADPFEPTPLTTMIGRHPGPAQSSHKPVVPQQAPSTMQATSMSHSSVPPVATSSNVRTAVSQHMMQATPVPHMKSTSHHPTPSHHPSTTMHIQTSHHQSSAHHSSNSNHHAHTRPKSEREAKRAKEQFLMFTRVLMKYLEQKDPQMHARAKEVIRECAEKNKKKEQGYESVTASMKTRLRATVGEQYWKRADSYLTHFQEMQRRKKLKDQNDKISLQNAARQQQQQQSVIQKQLEAQRARNRMKEKERFKKLKEENIRKQNAQKKKENEIRAQQMARIQEENKRRINNGKQRTIQTNSNTAASVAVTPSPKKFCLPSKNKNSNVGGSDLKNSNVIKSIPVGLFRGPQGNAFTTKFQHPEGQISLLKNPQAQDSSDDKTLIDPWKRFMDNYEIPPLPSSITTTTTITGRALEFVHTIIDVMKTRKKSDERWISLLSRDALVFQAEAMMETQEKWKRLQKYNYYPKNTRVDIGYHYTQGANIESLKRNGLLNRIERQRDGIRASKNNGAVFGEGIYTANNPTSHTKYGNLGLVVIRLKGNEGHIVDSHSRPDIKRYRANNNCIIHDTRDMVILQHSHQCMALLQYSTEDFAEQIKSSQILKDVWKVVDKYFNTDTITIDDDDDSFTTVMNNDQVPNPFEPTPLAKMIGRYIPPVTLPQQQPLPPQPPIQDSLLPLTIQDWKRHYNAIH